MNYVLDTDTIIYFLKGHPSVVSRITAVSSKQLHTTTINHAELLFGVYHSIHKKRNLANIQAFFQHFSILVFCKNASHLFAEHKTLLKTNGNSLADMDLMIASIALHHEMVLVTNNIKHFNRIKKLKLENWAEK